MKNIEKMSMRELRAELKEFRETVYHFAVMPDKVTKEHRGFGKLRDLARVTFECLSYDEDWGKAWQKEKKEFREKHRENVEPRTTH